MCGAGSKMLATGAKQGTDRANTYCNDVGACSAKFLFIPDRTAPATGAVLGALLVMYIASQLLSSLLMSVTADKNQRYIMLALPFVFVLFVKGFPAGLLVYWITTNLWTVGQQYFIRRSTGQLPTWLGGDGAIPTPAMAGGAAAAVAAPTPRVTKEKGADKTAAAPDVPASPAASPPPPPRRKKKRSGRRR